MNGFLYWNKIEFGIILLKLTLNQIDKPFGNSDSKNCFGHMFIYKISLQVDYNTVSNKL